MSETPRFFQPEPVDAVEAFTEERTVLIAHWDDNITSVCTDAGSCHFSEDKDKTLYYIAQSWYTDLGFKIRQLI